MTSLRHAVARRSPWSGYARLVLGLSLVAGVDGCHRRPVRTPFLIPPPAPVEQPAAPRTGGILPIEPQPETSLPERRYRPPRPPSPRPAAPATPAPAAPVAPAPETFVFSTADDVTPEQKKTVAADLRRAQARAARVRGNDSGIRNVRNFLQQAQASLASGDVDGARVLTTKATMLLDEMHR
jgi:hypothetical protein